MKRILAVAVSVLLVATAAVKAAPPLFSPAGESASSLVETAQFKKGKGFKKGWAFKKGPKGKAAMKGKGPQCFNKCIAKGNSGMQCQGRCR
jgi:hypothetical protein